MLYPAKWCNVRHELEGTWVHALHYNADGEARCFYCYQLLDTQGPVSLPFGALPYIILENLELGEA